MKPEQKNTNNNVQNNTNNSVLNVLLTVKALLELVEDKIDFGENLRTSISTVIYDIEDAENLYKTLNEKVDL